MKIRSRLSFLVVLFVTFQVLAGIALAVQPTDLHRCQRTLLGARENAIREYQHGGIFQIADAASHRRIADIYRRSGTTKTLSGKIRRVTEDDLSVNLEKAAPSALEALAKAGRKELSKLYYFTSGAGLWTRGGRRVKALIPFNMAEFLTPDELRQFLDNADITSVGNPTEVLKAAKRKLQSGENIAEIADAIVQQRSQVLSSLIAKARSNLNAQNAIDLKYPNVAIYSALGQTYIPFDIWTGEQVHSVIGDYLNEFENTYMSKIFHEDAATDAKIKKALAKYIEESHARGETHLFGYQLGYHAFDPESLEPVMTSEAIGEGHGMAKAYLDKLGRTADLLADGKTTWVFENIEVMTDLAVAMGAHVQGGKLISVVLVPEKKGYKGGSPLLIDTGKGWNIELHEQDTLPAEFKAGNIFFNTNTLFADLRLSAPHNFGFELKPFGRQTVIRVKSNVGDITHGFPTAAIGGRIGEEYENLKSLRQLVENGPRLIKAYQARWFRDLQDIDF